jgi:hypothetical protein
MFFGSANGVRQGENLSPLLFSLFLNDLEEFLIANGCTFLDLKLDLPGEQLSKYVQLLALLYADDTILLSDTAKGLQTALSALCKYCETWKLQVNPAKSKVMIFYSRNNREQFYYNDTKLEVVNSYKYLGIVFSRTGNFYQARKLNFEKAQRAMFSLLRSSRRKKLPVSVTLHLFQVMVIPVLLYGCEIWGYENTDILEKLQIKFLKHLFRLPRATMNNLIYGETGLYPVSVLIQSRVIRFWSGILLPESDKKISTKLYNVLLKIHVSTNHSFAWLQFVRHILVTSGFDCVWNSHFFMNRDVLCKNIQVEAQNAFKQSWYESITVSSKSFYYKHFKKVFQKEKYIDLLPETYALSLIKFRCSSHKLPIETGRKFGIVRENRICKDCNMLVIGDEFHFIMECPKFDVLRSEYLPRKFTKKKSMFHFVQLMSGNIKHKLGLAKFIQKCKVI